MCIPRLYGDTEVIREGEALQWGPEKSDRSWGFQSGFASLVHLSSMLQLMIYFKVNFYRTYIITIIQG
jgi:hypothetical protein